MRSSQMRQRDFFKALMIILKCRTAERPIAGRRACNLPRGSVPGYLAAVAPHSARLFRERVRRC